MNDKGSLLLKALSVCVAAMSVYYWQTHNWLIAVYVMIVAIYIYLWGRDI